VLLTPATADPADRALQALPRKTGFLFAAPFELPWGRNQGGDVARQNVSEPEFRVEGSIFSGGRQPDERKFPH
jgi:hypothetical protein